MLVRQQHCRDRRRGTRLAALSKEPGVVFSTNYQYMCSQTGQQMIQDKIHEYGLTGVVICSCSPRMHEQTFRKTCEKAGLNPYMVEIANIREQCSWIHKDKEVGTEKAIILGPRRHRQGASERAADRGFQPRDQARARHRRRHRGHPDGAGHCRGGL